MVVIGDEATVLVFRSLGIPTYIANNEGEAREALKQVKDHDIIFITERLAANIEFDPGKTVVTIPDVSGSVGLGTKRLKDLVERAVGVDILSRREKG